MFGSKRNTASSEEVETIIGKDTQFKGTINAKGSVRIDGAVEGEVVTSSTAVVGQTGNVSAQIKAANATVAGTVQGNMEIAERLELLSTAKLYGDIKVGALIIGEGAVFKGACEMTQSSQIVKKKE